MLKIKESDLYEPIKKYLTELGFEVKGEINNCDIVAQKQQQLIVIELKLTVNLTLLMQAVDRLSLTDDVYIAIPKQASVYKQNNKRLKKLIARLGLGLIIVDYQAANQYVEIIHDPKDYQPRKNKRKQSALLKEFNGRQGDTQKGGSTRAKAGLTAYRQRCIRVAEYLLSVEKARGVEINKAIDEPQATQFLRANYYKWFDKVERGVYTISETGRSELPEWLTIVKRGE